MVFIEIKMASSRTVSLSLIVAFLCCILFPMAAGGEPDLAIQVCQNTTDFAFCRDAVYSDPHTPGANKYQLADIIFREAYLNATDTRDYIAAEIKSGRGSDADKKCLANYGKSIGILETMLNDLNSESYYELDVRSLDVERNFRACRKGLARRSPLAKRNGIMLKFANMCYVISNNFEYH